MNILVIRVGNIGDVLMATPFLRKVHHLFPESSIDFVTSPHARESVACNPYIKNIFVYKKLKGFLGAIKKNLLVQRLRLRSYGMIFVLEEHAQYKEFAFQAGPKAIKVGFLGKGDQCLDRKSAFSYERHVIDNALFLLKEFFGAHLEEDDTLMDFSSPHGIEQSLSAFLPEWKGALGKYFVIHPGCSAYLPYRAWEASNYPPVIRFLRAQGYRVFLTGTKAEKSFIDDIIKDYGHEDAGVEVFVDRHFYELAFLIEHGAGILVMDTGIMHLARALDVPVLSVFGPSNPDHTGCTGKGTYVQIRNDFKCGPCNYYPQYRMEDKKNCLDGLAPACIRSISVEQVTEGLKRILAHG